MPTHQDYGHGTTMPAERLAEIVAYVLAHRTGDGRFDLVVEGEYAADPDAAVHQIVPYRDVGLTWWIEKLGWWRGDLPTAIERIDAGPPNLH